MFLKESLDQLDPLGPRLDHHHELAQFLEFAPHHELDLGNHLVQHHLHLLIDLVLNLAH